MEPFSVIAFDPGGTTGIAMATYGGDPEEPVDAKIDFQIKTDELGPDEHHGELWDFILDWYYQDYEPHPKYIISESFDFRQNLEKKGLELVSKEYIGLFKFFAARNGLTYFERNAGQAKKFVSDEKLDALGILEVPKYPNRHRNDALRHLIMYLVVNLRIQSPITNQWRN